ncbi:MAG: M15 family metallopeptidase [Bradyrhizobium sp.]|nr:M15 family metallopeptidase [Bradyrhizobium sp.]
MSDTLKDFLVSVGFKLDEISQRQAEGSIKKMEGRVSAKAQAETKKRAATEKAAAIAREKERQAAEATQAQRRAKSLKEMGVHALRFAGIQAAIATITELTALGIVKSVDTAAKSFDRLTYAARLSGSSAANVTAFGYAASQLGSSAPEAQSQLATFGNNLKYNPTGYSRTLQEMGIKTRDAQGKMRDFADVATDLGDFLRKTQKDGGQYGYANAINQGAAFGFDENLVRALMNPDFRKREGQQKSDQSRVGADPNAAAEGGTAYEQSLRRLLAIMDNVGTKVDEVLFVKLKPMLDQLSAWFLANGNRIADIVSRIADDLIRLALAIGQKLAGADWDKILDRIEALAKSLGEVLDKLSGEQGLVILLGSFALALAALATLRLPMWLLGIMGVTAAAMATNPGQAKAEPDGRSGFDGASGGQQSGRRSLGARIGSAARKMSGIDALRLRGRSARDARHAASAVPSSPLPDGLIRQSIVGGANLMSGGHYPGAVAGSDLVTITTSSGRRLTVHRDAAPSFKRFLDQLESRGYKINSLGGYANRGNRSDPGRLSEHAFGNAIDINPGTNPFHSDQTDMPADISKLAAENGLSWGGDWRPGHRDPMHFEWRGARPWEKKGAGAASVGEKPTPEDLLRSQYDAYRSPQNPFLHGKDVPVPAKPLGDTPAIHQSMLNNYRGDTNLTSAGIYNVGGGDGRGNLEAARAMSARLHRDLVKEVQAA